MSNIPTGLGGKVSTRTFIWGDLVIKAWGSEWSAPDHKIYEFGGYVSKDSTDKGKTGIYGVRADLLDFEIQDWGRYPPADMFDPLRVDSSGEILQYDVGSGYSLTPNVITLELLTSDTGLPILTNLNSPILRD